jgi:hypothetical protein
MQIPNVTLYLSLHNTPRLHFLERLFSSSQKECNFSRAAQHWNLLVNSFASVKHFVVWNLEERFVAELKIERCMTNR